MTAVEPGVAPASPAVASNAVAVDPAALDADLAELERRLVDDDVPAPVDRDGGLRHIRALDGLRGMAVLAVLLFHADLLTGGYLGVDLFFVLSGFLITRLLVAEGGRTGTIRLGSFWARRARRLLPALGLLLLAMPVFARLVAVPVTRGQIRADGLATMFYVANWHSILDGQNYWNQLFTPSPLSHTWSLAIEEQFYLVWPVVVWWVLRHRPRPTRSLLRIAVAGAAVSAGLMIVLSVAGVSASRLYLGSDTRVAAVLFGAVVALLAHERGPVRDPRSRTLLELAAWAGVVLLAVAWLGLDGQSALLYRGGLAACGIAAAVVVAALVQPTTGWLGRLLSTRVLCWFGLLSYGIYLAHWPIYLVLSPSRTGSMLESLGIGDGAPVAPWPLFAIRVAVTVALAYLSYRFVELPVRERRVHLAAPVVKAVIPVTAMVLALALLWSTGDAVSVQRLVEQRPAGASPAPTTAPQPVIVAGAPRVMVVGDSVAFSLHDTEQAAQEVGASALDVGEAGCPLLSPSLPTRSFGEAVEPPPNGDCVLRWAPATERFRPDVAVVVFGSLPLSETRLGGRWAAPCDAPYEAELRRRVQGWVEVLGRTGAKVVLTTPAAPGTDRYPPEYDTIESSVPFRDLQRRLGCITDVYRQVAATTAGVSVIDLAGWVCPDGQCRARTTAGTAQLRVDHLHYTPQGAEEAVAWLYPAALRSAHIRAGRAAPPPSTLPLQEPGGPESTSPASTLPLQD